MPAEKYSIQKKKLRGVEQGMPDGVVIDRTTGEYLLVKDRYPVEVAVFILDISISDAQKYLSLDILRRLPDGCFTRDSILNLHTLLCSKKEPPLRGWKEICALMGVSDERTAKKILIEKNLLVYEAGRPVLLASEYRDTLRRKSNDI